MSKKMRYYLSIFSLAIGGSSIFLLMYARFVFYDQMIEAMNVTNEQLGLLTAFSGGVALLLTPFEGLVADRCDSKRVIIVSIGATSVLAFLFGFITTYPMAVAVWTLMGFTTGLGYWQSFIKFLNGLGEPEEAGRSFTIYYGIYGAASAAVNAAEVWAGDRFGFQGAVFVIAGINAAAVIMDIFLLDGNKDKLKRGEKAEQPLSGDDKIKLTDIKYVLKWPGTYIFAFVSFCACMLYSHVAYFNPYLIDVMGMPAELSRALSVIRNYLILLICPLGGIIADKVFKSTAKTAAAMFTVSGMLLAAVLLFRPGMNMWAAAIYSLVPSVIILPLFAVYNSIIRELHVPNAILGTMLSTTGILGATVDIVPPVIYGRWLDNYGNSGYNMIFISLAATCAGGVLSSLWAVSHDRKCREGKRMMDIGRKLD